MELCDPIGRDCIERNSANSFNCSTTCEGVYAYIKLNPIEDEMKGEEVEDVVETESKGKVDEHLNKLYKQLGDLRKEIMLLKSNGQEKGKEVDKEKYEKLIAEYRNFKTMNVKHFRFSFAANASAFGEL